MKKIALLLFLLTPFLNLNVYGDSFQSSDSNFIYGNENLHHRQVQMKAEMSQNESTPKESFPTSKGDSGASANPSLNSKMPQQTSTQSVQGTMQQPSQPTNSCVCPQLVIPQDISPQQERSMQYSGRQMREQRNNKNAQNLPFSPPSTQVNENQSDSSINRQGMPSTQNNSYSQPSNSNNNYQPGLDHNPAHSNGSMSNPSNSTIQKQATIIIPQDTSANTPPPSISPVTQAIMPGPPVNPDRREERPHVNFDKTPPRPAPHIPIPRYPIRRKYALPMAQQDLGRLMSHPQPQQNPEPSVNDSRGFRDSNGSFPESTFIY